MNKIISITIVVTAICIMALTPTVSADEVNFSQIDFYLDGVPTLNSDWGYVEFTFTGQDPIMYFNLAVNGTWQVQNIPVLSGRGVGVEQNMTYYFDLGVESGTDVISLNYDYTFTSDILDTMPGGSTPASVGDDSVKLWAGFEGGSMPELTAAKPLVGGEVSSSKKYAHKNFPNQECGEKECAPAAVSNSLKFLNEKHKLGMTDDQINITAMKKAVGFETGWGASLDTWWQTKKEYMDDPKNNYPITTEKITNISELAAHINSGQDVEIQQSWLYWNKTEEKRKRTGHTTCLIGIAKLENGNYSLDVSDDRKQNELGGTDKPMTYTYNPTTGNFTENSNGFVSKFEYAVVEHPKEKEVPVLTPLGLIALIGLLSVIAVITIRRR